MTQSGQSIGESRIGKRRAKDKIDLLLAGTQRIDRPNTSHAAIC